jgi:pyruvate dehydrogenase E2 component (dihydrolipoamide acetyltransferase)
MSTEFKLPELGENVEKGDVIRVLVAVGDEVVKDQPVVELETDKATIEVPSSVAGKVTSVNVKVGDKVSVGQVVLVVDSATAAEKAPDKAPVKEPPAEEPAQKEPAPDQPAREDPEPEQPERQDPPGRRDRSGENVVDIASGRQAQAPRPESAPAAPAAPAASAAPAPATTTTGGAPSPAAPSVRRFARELGVDIGQVTGTGPGGRIGQQDVAQFVKTRMTCPSGGGFVAAPLPDFSKWGEVDVQKMSNIRRKTAEHLTHAWHAPHVTQHDKADVTAFDAFRVASAKRVEKAGGKLTVTAMLIRLLAVAIDRFPQFASSVDMANESIVVKKYRHIGVAVDTPNGLLVPVIRDVNRKTVTDIAVELATVSQKARDRKLSLDDMSGGGRAVRVAPSSAASRTSASAAQARPTLSAVTRATTACSAA